MANSAIGTSVAVALPAGMVVAYAVDSAPAGWLLCYGQAVSRATYDALFAAIGTVHGTGDGSTTFNLPDLRGRVVAGTDDMGGSSANRLTSPLNGDTFGAAGGAESVTLDTTMIPSHQHGIGNITGYATNTDLGAGYGQPAIGTNNASSGATGGGAAHANVQPTMVLNYIIKT